MKTLAFGDQLDFTYAAELKKELGKSLKSGKEIKADLGQVERASLACLQVLIAARKKAREDGFDIHFILSEALGRVLEDLGLTEFFGEEVEGIK